MSSSTLIVGAPGAGKTSNVVQHGILPAIKAGQRVTTNVPLFPAEIAAHLGLDEAAVRLLINLVTNDDIRKPNFWFCEHDAGPTISQPGDFIVIDEVHAVYPSDDRAIKLDSPVCRAARYRRKYAGGTGNFSTSIQLLSQSYNDLHKKVREACDSLYFIQKLSMVGENHKFRIDVFSDVRQPPQRQTPVQSLFAPYDPAVLQCYDSYSVGVGGFVSGAVGVEEVRDERLDYWSGRVFFGLLTRRKAKFVGIGFAVVGFLAGAYMFASALSSAAHPPAPAAAVAPVPASAAADASAAPAGVPGAVPAAAAPVSSAPAKPAALFADDSEYRLAGLLRFNGTPVAVVVSNGSYRYLPATQFELVEAGPARYIKYNGKIIAPWTGSGGGLLNGVVGSSK